MSIPRKPDERKSPTHADARRSAEQLRMSEQRLARALFATLSARRATPELREAIAGYVSDARGARRTWRDTLAAVNALMRQAAGGQPVSGDSDGLAQCILTWCEEEYAQGGP